MQDLIKIISVEKEKVEQNTYKLTYNQRQYTFIDYVYNDTGLAVAEGEFAVLVDNQGNTIKDSKLIDAIGSFVDEIKF